MYQCREFPVNQLHKSLSCPRSLLQCNSADKMYHSGVTEHKCNKPSDVRRIRPRWNLIGLDSRGDVTPHAGGGGGGGGRYSLTTLGLVRSPPLGGGGERFLVLVSRSFSCGLPPPPPPCIKQQNIKAKNKMGAPAAPRKMFGDSDLKNR